MSRYGAVKVRKLCRRLQPSIQGHKARRELAQVCGIRHRQQMSVWFPRRGAPAPNVRLTAPSALAALRWLEERPRKKYLLFVPGWETLRSMGRHLIRPKGFVAILANYVGGGISEDQIYSYFSTRRRRPDGEFVLRLLEFIVLLQHIDAHPTFGPRMNAQLEWADVREALLIYRDAEKARMAEVKRNLFVRRRPRNWLPGETPELLFQRMAKKRV